MGSINIINGGLDVKGLVDNLIYVEREPVRRLESETTTLQSKISAFQSLNAKVSSLLDKVNNILFDGDTVPFQTPYAFAQRLPESIFSRLKATSSDTDKITATASKGSAVGTYALTVTSLAQAKSMASGNFADTNTTRTGTGTLVLQTGTNTPVTVNIDTTNNTLEGLKQAINNANAGVSATIINDGSASPYRLLISSKDSGTANAFTLSDNLAGGQVLGLSQTVAAADAQISVNGVSITKSSNTISDVIDGVSFTLQATTASAVNLVVDKDLDSIVSALKDLVTAYNDINSFTNAQFKYDATAKKAGILSGDPTLRSTQAKIQGKLTQSIVNSFTSYRVGSQVGLKFNNDGSVTLNEGKLRDALTDDFTGVAALFLGDGTAAIPDGITVPDSRVTYSGKTSATQYGTYDIEVTGLAQQASVTGQQTITTLDVDETLSITVGGTTATANLSTGDSLATVLSKINSALSGAGISATAADDGTNAVRISTDEYGSAQSISVLSDRPGGAGSTGFATTPTTGTGTDVAGTINGHTGVGSGLTLNGAAGNPEEGLSLLIAQSTTGSYGTVTIASGAAGDEGASIMVNLQTTLKNITDPLSGPIHNVTDGLNGNIASLKDQISAWEDRLDVRRELLTVEFSRADQALRLLSVTQTSLSNQVSSLAKIQ